MEADEAMSAMEKREQNHDQTSIKLWKNCFKADNKFFFKQWVTLD